MKSSSFVRAFLLLVLTTLISATLHAEGWKTYTAKEYGFSMLVPEGTEMKEKEWSDGWGGLYAEFEGVKLWGLAKLGEKATDEEIEKFAVKLVGVPSDKWTVIDSGKNKGGWIRYHTVKATKGSKLMFGGYGVGPKGSYLLYMETTTADFAENKADYEKWYASVVLE